MTFDKLIYSNIKTYVVVTYW